MFQTTNQLRILLKYVKICQNVAKKKANPAGVLGGPHEKKQSSIQVVVA